SKVACWAILFDLLQTCSLLRDHVAAGKVAFGINHEMRDFKQDRKKNLDLVLCGSYGERSKTSFGDYGKQCGVVLDSVEKKALDALPELRRAPVANVHVALEAKACMTEHGKALPRLHDELASSHQTIHGDTGSAIAAGFVMINCAETFVSPDRNRKRVRNDKFVVNQHKQPFVAEKTLAMVMKIPRRSDEKENGFDAVGIAMVRCANNGSPVILDPVANAALPDIVRYASFIRRISHLYSTKFAGI
ncbi:MAG: hypothetical protein ABIZ49_11805, partial [Opitutaceae bacterium]